MTPDEQKKAFEAELYTWVGKEIAPPTPGLDLVNEAMIRHWCEVMGDTNPCLHRCSGRRENCQRWIDCSAHHAASVEHGRLPDGVCGVARPIHDGRPAQVAPLHGRPRLYRCAGHQLRSGIFPRSETGRYRNRAHQNPFHFGRKSHRHGHGLFHRDAHRIH
jgi:hypothetical protein